MTLSAASSPIFPPAPPPGPLHLCFPPFLHLLPLPVSVSSNPRLVCGPSQAPLLARHRPPLSLAALPWSVCAKGNKRDTEQSNQHDIPCSTLLFLGLPMCLAILGLASPAF